MKEKIDDFIKSHKILTWIIGSLLTIGFEELVKSIVTGLFGLNIYLNIEFNDNTGIRLGWLVTIVLAVITVTVIGLFILNLHFREKRPGKYNCSDESKNSIDEMIKHKEYFKKIANLVDEVPALKSVQIYECSELPTVNKHYKSNNVVLKFKRIGGYSKKNYRTNCILFDEFVCSRSIYKEMHKIILSARDFYHDIDASKDYNHEDMCELIDDISELMEKLMSEFLSLKEIEDIKDEHYFYYRLYLVLMKLSYDFSRIEYNYDETSVIEKPSEVSVFNKKYVLEDAGVDNFIEDNFKLGKRSGILGAFLLNRLQLFGNEHSLTKTDRSYFASPVENNRLYVFTYNRKLLNLTEDDNEYSKCRDIFNGFAHELGVVL